MAAISAAQALMNKRVQFPGARKLMTTIPGMYKMLENFDATSGALLTAVGTALTGTTADSFGLASSESDGKFVISVNTTGTNHTVTLKAPVTSQTVTLTLPDVASDTICGIGATQTLTNKTLTTPTIGSFVNATHDHSNAAGGGAIVASGITGSTANTFTINYGAVTETEIAITSVGTSGGFTATLSIPTLAADRRITFPDVTSTLAILGANTFTGAQTIGTGASIAASGTGSFDMSGSTGATTTTTGTNTLSGNVVITGSKTLITGTGAATLKGSATFDATKTLTFGAAGGGTTTPITMYSSTTNRGALILAVTDATGNFSTTITNGDALAATVITMPNATSTLATLGLNQTLTGNQVITGTLDIRGAVSSGASNPNFNMSGSSGTFLTCTGNNTLSGHTTVAAGKNFTLAVGAGVLTCNGATSGSIVISPISVGTNATTLINQAGGSAKDITLPSATATLATLGLAETFSGIKTFTAAPIVAVDSAATNTVVTVLTVGHSSSGTAASGFGTAISFKAEDASGNQDEVATIGAVLSTATHGATESADIVISALMANALYPAITVDVSDLGVTIGQNATNTAGLNKLRIFPLTAASGSLILQAAVDAAGDHATTLTNAVNAAAAATVTLPSGSSKLAGLITETATTHTGNAQNVPLTHGMVACTTGGPGEAWGLLDGFPGQILHIRLATDGGGDGTLTPTTKLGYTNIVFADAGDAVTLQYVVTLGWIILGAYGFAAPPAIA